METLRVGILSDVAYPFTHGGAEKRVALLGAELAARGHDVTVYAMRWWEGPAVAEHDGVTYVGVAPARALYADEARRSLRQPAAYALRAARAVAAAPRHDVLDCNQFPFLHYPPARWAAAKRREPMAVTWHEVWGAYWHGYAPFPASLVGIALEDAMPHWAAHNIAVSGFTASRLRGLGVAAERVSVVPNPVDVARIEAAPAWEEPCDVVFAGRLVAHKRVDRLLAALAHARRTVPGLRGLVVGDGPDAPRLRALASALGLEEHVRFAGALPEDALLGALKSARVFASASDREGFGVAALEAMACGLPVVAVGGAHTALAGGLVLDGYNGLVAPPRARGLAAALVRALGDEPERRRLAEHARATAAHYDRARVAPLLEAAYRRTMGRAVAPPAAPEPPATARAAGPAEARA